MVKHIISCDELAIIPPRGCGYGMHWQIKDEDQPDNRLTGKVTIERKDDSLYINGNKVLLHRSRKQQDNKAIVGHELYQELKGSTKILLPANILDYLLEHTELIPNSWKGKVIFFWGTIYRLGTDLVVRHLRLDDSDRWDRDSRWLGYDWRSYNPAAVLAQARS